jgi:hypothetical protein
VGRAPYVVLLLWIVIANGLLFLLLAILLGCGTWS